MRILLWLKSYWPTIGGVELLVGNLIPSLQVRGHQFMVVTEKSDPRLPDQQVHNGLRIHRFAFYPLLKSKDPVLFAQTQRQLNRLVRDYQPDIFQLFTISPIGLFCLRSARKAGKPLIMTLLEKLPECPADDSTMYGRILRSADWLTTCYAGARDEACRLIPGLAARSSVIYNGIPRSPTAPPPLPTDPPRLLCLGRLSPEKGFDLAISAFARLAADFPDLKLTLAGDGKDRPHLEAQVNSLALRDRVDFPGFVANDSVFDLMAQATIVIIPSRTEGLPLVAVEAMFAERPVVATRVGGLPEAVVEGQTGLLVEKDDLDSLTTAVRTLLDNPDRAQALGRKGRRLAIKKFDWDSQVVARYDALYRTVAADQKKI